MQIIAGVVARYLGKVNWWVCGETWGGFEEWFGWINPIGGEEERGEHRTSNIERLTLNVEGKRRKS